MFFFFFNETATTEIYPYCHPLPLHDALPTSRSLFRYPPDYRPVNPATRFDWSAWGGLSGAVEICNNNGTCRKRDPGTMCPSFRVTGDETQDRKSTRLNSSH